jgi:hypothetical protein
VLPSAPTAKIGFVLLIRALSPIATCHIGGWLRFAIFLDSPSTAKIGFVL